MPRDLRWWEAGFMAICVSYFAWHMALAVAHVTPDQFMEAVRRSLGG